MQAVAFLALGLMSSAFADSGTYNYVRTDTSLGPSAWATNFATCGGSSQSPINIDTVMEMDRVDWTWTKWSDSSNWNVSNGGSSVKFTLAGADIVTAGGGLPNTYKVAQFHFHWGQVANMGSEHTVNAMSYPLEMHVVHMRNDFSDLGAALASGDSDALAVISVFFESQTADNSDLDNLMSGIDLAQNYSDSAAGVGLTSLNQIVNDAISGDWFRYNGSLTTPTCNEAVVWTVFKTAVKIGDSQLAKFRSVGTGSYGTELYRPVQLQNNRDVYKYTDIDDDIPNTDGDNGATTLSASFIPLALSAIFVGY